MEKYKQILAVAGVLSFVVALFQAIIGFSRSLSLYFGAPEALVENALTLSVVSLMIAAMIFIFGLYAISGAGLVRSLPWLKQILLLVGGLYILRGLLIVPELISVLGLFEVPIPVSPRFVLFSIGSLLIGLTYLIGTIGGWHAFPSK